MTRRNFSWLWLALPIAAMGVGPAFILTAKYVDPDQDDEDEDEGPESPIAPQQAAVEFAAGVS